MLFYIVLIGRLIQTIPANMRIIEIIVFSQFVG